MKEIQKKIKELVDLSNIASDNWDKIGEVMDKQEKLFEELTAMARKKNTLLGRIIKFGVADGEAVYVIDKVNKKTVRVNWIDYCDGYKQYGMYEGHSNMNINEAKGLIHFEDVMNSLKNK